VVGFFLYPILAYATGQHLLAKASVSADSRAGVGAAVCWRVRECPANPGFTGP